ncbi:MAG: dihydropteroate synthase [Alphaproteobacteria bacterium]|nr:dihydropteroate synthase [Alphaproteobacteria bacterium]MDP6515956.1 dihydropteroate synthase [Alphaproteobacteria bacterium]
MSRATGALKALDIVRSPALPRGFDDSERLYLRPIGLVRGPESAPAIAQGRAVPLAGGPVAFTACEAYLRARGRARASVASVPELLAWRDRLDEAAGRRVREWLARLSAKREPVAGCGSDRPSIMGVVNVTPDSFSDGGLCAAPAAAIAHGQALAGAGAAIIDVGGESTRPGASPVPEAEERARVLPVVAALAAAGLVVSVDTRNAATMAAATGRGAAMINDISALAHQPGSLAAAAASGVPVVLMHSLGDPGARRAHARYAHAPMDVYDALARRVDEAVAAGIPHDRIVVDPGIGFAKTADHSVQVLRWLSLFHGLGCLLALGASRKSFIRRLTAEDVPAARLPGSLAAALVGLDQGVQILRVHDVAATAQAVAVWRAIGA